MFLLVGFILTFSILLIHAAPQQYHRTIRDTNSQDFSNLDDSASETATRGALTDEAARAVSDMGNEGDGSKATRDVEWSDRDMKADSSAGSSTPETSDAAGSIILATNSPDFDTSSTYEKKTDENESSHLEVRASPSDEESKIHVNTSDISDDNEQQKPVRESRRAQWIFNGKSALSDDKVVDGSPKSRIKRSDRSCASGNINVCNNCNVYIYNKLAGISGDSMISGAADESGTPESDKGKVYTSRNSGDKQEQQQYPESEMLYMPHEAMAEGEEHQKDKFEASYKPGQSQYVRNMQHRGGEYRPTSASNNDENAAIDKREVSGWSLATSLPESHNSFGDDVLVDPMRNSRATPGVSKGLKSRNAKYDMKFLGLMNEQNKKNEAAGETENSPGVDIENEENQAKYDELLLQSKDSAYAENDNVFVPPVAFVRKTRDVSGVSSEFDVTDKRIPDARNAEYDIAFLDLMKNQQSASHMRQLRNTTKAERNNGTTEEFMDPNEKIDSIVRYLGSMNRPSDPEEIVRSMEYGYDDNHDLFPKQIYNFEEGDNELRRKRQDKEQRIDEKMKGGSENDMGLGTGLVDESGRGSYDQRFDNIVKLLGSIKHEERRRQIRNGDVKYNSRISPRRGDFERFVSDSSEEKRRNVNFAEKNVPNPDLSGSDVELKSAPGGVLDNANDAITVNGPGADTILEDGSIPAKQGQISLSMLEGSTNNALEPKEISSNEEYAGDDTFANNFRRSVNERVFSPSESLNTEQNSSSGEEVGYPSNPKTAASLNDINYVEEYQNMIDPLIH